MKLRLNIAANYVETIQDQQIVLEDHLHLQPKKYSKGRKEDESGTNQRQKLENFEVKMNRLVSDDNLFQPDYILDNYSRLAACATTRSGSIASVTSFGNKSRVTRTTQRVNIR